MDTPIVDETASPGELPLSAEHIEELVKSGISPAFAAAAGVYTEVDPAKNGRALNWRGRASKSGPCLVYPYFDLAGKPMTFTTKAGAERPYVRLKPTCPRMSAKSLEHPDGKLIKYESPKDSRVRLYIPPQVRDRVADPSVPLLYTEGEKKVLCAVEHGFAAIGLGGVWSWVKSKTTTGAKGGARELIDDFAPIPLAGRTALIVFDSDAATNPNVEFAEAGFVAALRAAGAVPVVVRLPAGPDGAKCGLDDFVVQHGPAALRGLIDQAVAAKPGGEAEPTKAEKEKKLSASKAIALLVVNEAELWHDATDTGYATVGRRSFPIKSKAFKHWVRSRSLETSGDVPAADAMTCATESLEALAVHKFPLRDVFVRVGGHEGNVYLHLADEADTVIEVTPNGWAVCEKPPVRFRRAQNARPLPMPTPGGKIDDLRGLLNVTDDAQFALVVGWLCGCFLPGGPYTLVTLTGEQGSAKTTFAKVLKRLIDPTAAGLRSEPREPRDLMIAASNSHVLAFDNLSALPVWLSDSLCRLATGGGFSTRELYSDSGEIVFDSVRPCVLTGIEDYVRRGDLLERSILLHLEAIPEESRRMEADLWRRFDELHAGILGAILDRVSIGLKTLPSVALDRLPRMADFAKFCVACEGVTDGKDSEFLEAYTANQRGAHEAALDDSAVGAAVVKVMEGRAEWEGTASELLDKLTPFGPPDPKAKDSGWPKTPSALSNRMMRLAPDLRRVHKISFKKLREPGGDRKRVVRLVNSGTANPAAGTDRDGDPAKTADNTTPNRAKTSTSKRDGGRPGRRFPSLLWATRATAGKTACTSSGPITRPWGGRGDDRPPPASRTPSAQPEPARRRVLAGDGRPAPR